MLGGTCALSFFFQCWKSTWILALGPCCDELTTWELVYSFGAKKDRSNLDPSYRAWHRHMADLTITHMCRVVSAHRAQDSRSRGGLGPFVTADGLWEMKLPVLIPVPP